MLGRLGTLYGHSRAYLGIGSCSAMRRLTNNHASEGSEAETGHTWDR
jgi:hypothetical protein